MYFRIFLYFESLSPVREFTPVLFCRTQNTNYVLFVGTKITDNKDKLLFTSWRASACPFLWCWSWTALDDSGIDKTQWRRLLRSLITVCIITLPYWQDKQYQGTYMENVNYFAKVSKNAYFLLYSRWKQRIEPLYKMCRTQLTN